MKDNRKIQINATRLLVLLMVLIALKTYTHGQPKSWMAMEDIRQVTEIASVTSWEILKQDKGVTLSCRWVSFGDSIKSREIASHFVVSADVQCVLTNLIQPHKLLTWNDDARSLELLSSDDSTWITHTVYDIPYPFSQQDLVAKHVLLKENEKTIILMFALPDYIAPLKNVTRQQLYYGKWELSQVDDRTTEVHFSAISFSKSGIPRFIRDPIILHKLFHSFLRLKELSSAEAKAVSNRM